MNGYMLFAKENRIQLGRLAGEAWKSLPKTERDHYSQRAKVMNKKEGRTTQPTMNGLNLFAKENRIKLGRLSGEAWKSLPKTERDHYSQRAKVMAEETKKREHSG